MIARSLRSPLLLASAAALGLTACALPPDGGDPNANRTRDGVIIGATLGGLLGLSRDQEASSAIGGAAIGAIAGGLIGRQLDKQAAELRATLNDRVRIENTGSELVVTMPQDILFAVDSAAVQPALQSDLATLAQSLQSYPDTTVQVLGHTDNTGAATYNQALSTRRAAAVATILTNNGVPTQRIQAIGRGEDAPIASNLTADGRTLNRRVEIIIRPNAV